MGLILFSVIMLSEKAYLIKILRAVLVIIRVFFFFRRNFIFFFVMFELSIIPVLLLVIGYGLQVEKVGASYYLIFFIVLTSFPFLFVYFKINNLRRLVYVDFLLSEEMLFFLYVGFLVKFPIFFFIIDCLRFMWSLLLLEVCF